MIIPFDKDTVFQRVFRQLQVLLQCDTIDAIVFHSVSYFDFFKHSYEMLTQFIYLYYSCRCVLGPYYLSIDKNALTKCVIYHS